MQLADPEFHIPAPVQLLLGAGMALSTLCVGQISLSASPEFIIQKTKLGWIIGGNLLFYESTLAMCHVAHLQDDLSRFWEMEECGTTRHLSQEEGQCKKHFKDHFFRDSSGRYVVALPFNDEKTRLGETYNMAYKRLLSLEKRLKKDINSYNAYKDAIKEYIRLGYLSKIKEKESDGFFLPHQAVIKEASSTTKVRVVFDASAASSTGLFLNDVLLAGPTIQSDIFSLLLRFRLYNHVLTGDIEKMCVQLKVQPTDCRYLQILWRDDTGEVSIHRFNRLLFGLKPASFLATRAIHQLADDEGARFPRAAEVLKKDLYVDDLLTGADSAEEVIQLQKDITDLLHAGGFNLRQCASNTLEILSHIPDTSINLQLQNDKNSTLKTLEVHWNSSRDSIIYTVKPITERRISKRTIFSEIAKIFDPLGLLNPIIVTAKILIQELWQLKLEWDESVPIEMHTRWSKFATSLQKLNGIKFERKMLIDNYQEIELHGFCDASEKAYGACIYICSQNKTGQRKVQLYCAKSRVAPIKKIQSIPRLELCAAYILAELYETVRASINVKFNRVIFWTDSMITLHWINTSPHLLKTFVTNRVASVTTKTDIKSWRHVRTYHNPADLVSRGISPQDYEESAIWSKGPSWLTGGEEHWPAQQPLKMNDTTKMKRVTCLTATLPDLELLYRYSSYAKLQRIVAYCLRFKNSTKKGGLLSAEELRTANNRVLQMVQREEFCAEYRALTNNEPISTKSKLLSLSPFVDKDGLIRVGGRLDHSAYSYQQKHPIILPKSHHITRLLINKEHHENLHGGAQLTLYSLRQKYWPIHGRNQVRKVLRQCVRCARSKPRPVDYTMGSLPSVRTRQVRPFTNTGVDYCGPFFIKERRYRNRARIKVYVAVFICLTTKAVHLETVGDFTTESFLAALKRFISRRGRCHSIYSDNATNFVGANNELKELYELLTSTDHNQKVNNYLAEKQIIWKFNPAGSPHFGGIWEAAVKSFKHHFRRVVGPELFYMEQFNTLVIEIEAVLNSRPLTPLSTDPNDLTALTPSHFLIGDLLSSVPEANLTKTPVNRLSIWQHIQKVKQDFWNRWQREYLNELNVRHKWTHGTHPIKLHSVATIRDENLPPLQWRLGRVIEVQPGADGIIRVVRLRTSSGKITRSVKKLAPLPIDCEEPPKN